ncbi:DUF2914 domain-containing protein [Fodinibius halophilus]|uniref:DUF2914 domain-containing protein n=1 Tax=Fodinibius halophilus TaxID=1736908 RepID=A0A6M1T932_9BACT|nr:DUF2914 domain-containing protein [Fodinibius halophilus]NGP86912.1 DUF2914 domain-containing protein [Fodinibius halophilus]
MRPLKVILLLLLFSGSAGIIRAHHLRVPQITIAQEIQDRKPIKPDTSFSSNVGNVYCYTVIEGASDSTEVYHVWHYKDEEKAHIPLTVASQKWRTWSSKSILPSWTGPWRVEVEDSNGNVIAKKSFSISE